MRDKMAISAYIVEKSRKGPIFKASNQSEGYFQLKYTCTKFRRNETNLWSSFWSRRNIGKTFILTAENITIFTFSVITNFKTDRSLNNFEEHLFGLLRLKKNQTSLQNFFRT